MGLFSFSGAVQSDRWITATALRVLYLAEFQNIGRSVRVHVVFVAASQRGLPQEGGAAAGGGGGEVLRMARGERAMVGTKRGGRNFVNKICRAFSQKIRVGVCDLHRRTFVCQMAFQGLLGMLGSVIPQIIQPEHTKVA